MSNWEPLDDFKHAQIVLVGQPNCGKSTLFNEVAGYRSVTSNFPGVTVTYTRSHVRFQNHIHDVVDLQAGLLDHLFCFVYQNRPGDAAD